MALDPVRELLEVAGRIRALVVDRCQSLEIDRQIDSHHARSMCGQRTCQRVFALRPATPIGQQQDRIACAGRRPLHMQLVEHAITRLIIGRLDSPRHKQDQDRESR